MARAAGLRNNDARDFNVTFYVPIRPRDHQTLSREWEGSGDEYIRSERCHTGYSNKANIIKKLNLLPASCKLSGVFWALLGRVTRGALDLYRAEGQSKFTDWLRLPIQLSVLEFVVVGSWNAQKSGIKREKGREREG